MPEELPLAMRMDVVPGFRKTALAQWAKRHLAPGTAVVPWGLPLVVSDGLNGFPGVIAADCTHVPLITGGGAASAAHPMFMWVNTVLGNVKNALHGTYDQRKSPRDHALKPKYLQRYLSEFCYRFNRRFKLQDLVPRLIHAAANTPPLPYRLLTADGLAG
jgi:hypothetical protein